MTFNVTGQRRLKEARLMVITDLDKKWCRWQTALWISEGKLKVEPCAVCGDPNSYVVHFDWSNPARIKWLCEAHRSERLLSVLQRTLLHQALMAFESQATDGYEFPTQP